MNTIEHEAFTITDDLCNIRQFLPRKQFSVLASLCRGEEREFFQNKILELSRVINSMPKSYDTDGQGNHAVAYLHYFTGSWDWYITEKDIDEDGEGQRQAFGLVKGFETELGYIDIMAITRVGAELDLHWMPKTLGDIRKASRAE